MRQVLAVPEPEIARLREENAKWRQRVPKITETLRVRTDALAHLQRRNVCLQAELEALQVAFRNLQADSEPAPAVRDLQFELERLAAERTRLEAEVASLETRNRLLHQTVEILTTRLGAAVEDLARLRAAARGAPVAFEADTADAQTKVLLRIRGIGEKTLGMLVEAGISSVAGLADLHDGRLDDPDCPLFPLRARIRKQRWIAQARELLSAPPVVTAGIPSETSSNAP